MWSRRCHSHAASREGHKTMAEGWVKEQAAVICQQTSTNKTSRTEHSQKYGRVSGHKNQGPREKARYFFKKHNKNKQNFLQVDCFHTRHSNPFSGVRCATPSQRGSSMAVCFRKKSAGSCLCCTVLYKNMWPWLGCSMHRLLPCQCPQHT